MTAMPIGLTKDGIALEMLAGPLTGIYDSTGTGRVLSEKGSTQAWPASTGHGRRQAYPEAGEQAHTDFVALQART
jgi:hypothetical protein